MSMKHLISRTRKAACTLAAAALALSCWPLSAFAADADVSYGDGSNTTKVGIRLTAPQINVQAPVRITFGDAEAIDISTTQSQITSSARVKFVNRTQRRVYLAAADVVQTTSANIGNVFDMGKVLSNSTKPTFSSSRTANGESSTMTCTLDDASTNAAKPFGFTGDSQETAFAIEKPTSSNTEVQMAIDLALSFPKDTLQAAARLGSGKLQGNTTSICSISWTFALGTQTADELFATDGFYLKIAEEQVGKHNTQGSDIPASMLGKVFSLDDVKAHAKALSAGKASEDVRNLYNALVTSCAPEGDYTCYVKLNDQAWPVRIIGVAQDVVAVDTKNYKKDDLAGLTFRFRDCVTYSQMKPTSSKGWFGDNSCTDVRAMMQDGGSLYENLSQAIKASIVPVKKWSYNGTEGVTKQSEDKMFLNSVFELTGRTLSTSGRDKEEGTGQNHDQQYTFFRTNIGVTPEGGKWFAANAGPNNTSTIISKPSDQGPDSFSIWWVRTYAAERDRYASVYKRTSWAYANTLDLGIIPCFCL